MSKKLLIATHNPGKVEEFKKFLTGYNLVSLRELGVTEDVEEDGKTYQENSEKKALFYSKLTGLPTISDDGGLEIDYLNGLPGIRSRRWLGRYGTDNELFNKLKEVSVSMPDKNRNAKFIVAVSFALPTGEVFTEAGEINGIIAKEPLSETAEGLIYRLFFYLPEYGKYYHDKSLDVLTMNKINHRKAAFDKLKSKVNKYY